MSYDALQERSLQKELDVKTHHVRVPQGAYVERDGGAEAGQHGEPKGSGG